MKEFMSILVEPFQEKALTSREKLIIGVVAPATFIVVCILVNLLP